MKTKVEERFSEFFENWMCQLHEYLQHLQRASEDYRAKIGCEHEQELQASVSKVTQHYKDYYTIKWALAHEDVLAFFCPIWISPLENAYSWVTGWKPSAVLKLVNSIRINGILSSSLVELTQEQMRKIEALRVKIRLEEERVEREIERQHVTGWKPSAVLKLVSSIKMNGVFSSSLVELTQEHMRKIEALRVKIRLEEEKVRREMERQQSGCS
ncbi:protein DOG1-like 4 [Hevea brasiliensis]|uniref:protein DOG1-like 4 n=1 Tax=Hevea brasiliensis TaxID=3981 RepID=UPI0025FB702F|nr:protein DOG1-like 4 [Hevea brasiliensis]